MAGVCMLCNASIPVCSSKRVDKRKHSVTNRKPDGAKLTRNRPLKGLLSDWETLGKQLGSFVAVCGASLLLSGTTIAITNNQLTFLEAWRAVDRAYVDKTFNGQNWFQIRERVLKKEKLDTQAQTYDAIRTILASLNDPFTRFLEPTKFAQLQGGTVGSLTGVGIEVGFDMGLSGKPQMMVIAPAQGSPAAMGGISAGDALLGIDGVSTTDLSLYEAGEKLQGDEGTEVTLTVKSGGAQPRDVLLKRQKVVFNPVSYSVCDGVSPSVGPKDVDGRLGYLYISRFTSQTAGDMRTALKALQSEGVTRILLDLRNNGGGSFPAGISVAKMLLDNVDIVLIADSEGVRDILSADDRPVDATTPLAVLVNKGTASASEVLSGAIQDNKRGTLVGESTFGKGLIQTIIPLTDGSGVAVTTAKYQTPSGRDINRIGILPDIAIGPDALPIDASGAKMCKVLKSTEAPTLFAGK